MAIPTTHLDGTLVTYSWWREFAGVVAHGGDGRKPAAVVLVDGFDRRDLWRCSMLLVVKKISDEQRIERGNR